MLITITLIIKYVLTIAGVIVMLPVYIVVMLIRMIIEWFYLLFGNGKGRTEDTETYNR